MNSPQQQTTVSAILVNKSGDLKSLVIKNFSELDLYKKCGFKKNDGFMVQCEWKKQTAPVNATKINNDTNKTVYNIVVYGKKNGKANTENKYDFPPPLDNTLIFGNCIILLKKVIYNRETKKADNYCWINLTVLHWEKIYEKLFGGFEKLSATIQEDEAEENKLDEVLSNKKTKNGNYLKDGFVVSDDDDDDAENEHECENDCENKNKDSTDTKDNESDNESVVSSNSSSSFDSLSDSSASEQSDVEEDNLSEMSDNDFEASISDNDNDNDTSMVVKKPKHSKNKSISKKRKNTEMEMFHLSQLEKDELVSEGYISTDDEDNNE